MKHPSPTSMWNSAFKDRLVLVLWTAQFDLWIVSYMTSHFRLDPCIKTRMTTMARKHCEKKVKLKTRLLDFLKYFLLIIFFSIIFSINFQWSIENFEKSKRIFSNCLGKITIKRSERKRSQIKEFHRRCSVRGRNFYQHGKSKIHENATFSQFLVQFWKTFPERLDAWYTFEWIFQNCSNLRYLLGPEHNWPSEISRRGWPDGYTVKSLFCASKNRFDKRVHMRAVPFHLTTVFWQYVISIKKLLNMYA